MKSSLKLFVRILTSTILSFCFYSAQAQTVTIPAPNTNNGSVNDPLGTFYGFERTALIYTSAQIGTTGNINSVGFYVNSVATPGNAVNVRVYMKMRTTTFGAVSAYATETTGATLVYGPTTIPASSFVANTWVTLPLTTNFNYTGGTNNLEIIVETNATGAGNEGSTGKQFRYTTQTNNQFYQYWNADTSAPTGNGTRATTRPNVQLNFVVSTACSGTPAGGTSTSVTSACSGVNFTVSNTGQTAGTGLTYVWQSGPSNTGPWTNIGTASATYAALTVNQTTATYYRLLTTCTNSSTSTGSTPVLVNMGGNCTCLPYTIIVPTYTADEDIGNVTVGTLSNTTTCAQTGTGPGSSLNLFSNYAGSGVTVPNLQQGSSTSFSLTSITCGGNYGNGFQIYIDWNQNGNFNDVGEQMYSTGSNIVGPHTEPGTFTVPLTATLGSTRMRVVCVETTFPVATNYASTGYLWGETEDYCVNITVAPPCSGTPTSTAAASPSSMCGGNTSTLSLTGLSGTGISYQWQSGTSATGPWSNITGATGGTYTTPTLSSTSYFRCNVTCSGSGITSASSVATVTVTPAPAGATLSNPIFAGVLDCNPYSNTLSNAPGACIGNDLAAGTNQASEDIFYFFNLSNANNFNAIVNMSHCGTVFDTYIHLLNSGGALISENDDNGVLCTGTASSLQATLAPGFYYVVSEGFGANTGSINTQIQIAPITGTGSIAGLTTVCLPSTNTYTVSGLTNITGAVWTVPAGATIVSGQGTTSISVSFPAGAAGGNITCVPYNGPCSSATLTLAISTSSPAGNPSVSPTGQWNVYSYNAGDATGGSGAWTTNYVGYYAISNLSFDTQTGQTYSTAQSWVNTASPSSAAGYQGCSVQIDNHSYIFKRTGVPTCGTYRIDALNHDDMAILYVNGAEVWRHNGCCDVHIGVWTGYLDASSVLEYRISEGGGGSNAGLAFTQIATTATLTGTNPPSCLVNGTITISNVTGGACNLLSTGFGSLPSSTAVSGSAAITGEECVITTAANSLTGAWGYTPLIRPNAFGLIYNQFIGSGSGADGMSFSYGPFAYNTGGGETGWNTGLVVSFDTYNNATGTTNSRIYLSYNGVEFASNALGAFNLRTGTYIPVSINVNQAGQLTLVVNGTTIFNNTAVPAAYLSANKSTWNFAFSARTGGLNDAHKVDNVNLYADNYYEYSINGTSWQTSTTFSAPVGTYTVQARPICGTSCATTLGTVTLSSATLDWANTQYPATGEICQGGAFDVYGQVYEPGVTPGNAAQGPGITAQVGVFTSNTNPSTWPAGAWSTATFNSGGGGVNNDEYTANIGTSLTAGTYYYAFRYSLGGCAYQYGGYSASGGGFWDGTSNVNGQLIVRQVVPAVAVTAPINCNGGMADISVTGTGGVAPYVGETTATLVAGTYTYTLTDVNGCVGTTSYTVTEPALLVASVSGNNVLCNGGTTSVTVTATGGTAPYTGTGAFTVTAGTYSYTVTDANGCTSTASITITEPTMLTASSVVGAGINCNGGSTTVTVSANGGNAPYVGTGTFTALAGSSSYTVTDANGCTSISSITISEPTAIVVSYTATNISCTGGSAVVTISATGGTGTLLGTGSFVVSAGTYVYTVTDAIGCDESISVVISEPSIMNATASATNISCFGGASTVTVAATGGTGPYTGAGNFTVSAGTYSYTVTDANGCTASTSITVTEPTVLTASSTSTSISCNGGTATVTVTGNGGTGPYTGTGTFTASAGTTSYTVTDANGCTSTTTITISQPTAVTASSSATSILCNGGSSTVTVTGTGGTGPYNGTGTFTVSAGTYSYTVTDAIGCTATSNITVTEPTVLTASSTSTNISCNGGTATVTVTGNGGTGPYTGTGNFTVSAGTYSYTVTDANGCTASTSITVTEPTVLTASYTSTGISCNGGTATVTVTGNGGTGPYTGTGTFTASAGTTSYTVTDANGCTATTSIAISQPTALVASSVAGPAITCNGGTTTVTVSAVGGTGSYSGTGVFTVGAGTYSYTVTDANGCTSTTSVTITQPAAIAVSSTATSISCTGGSAVVTITATGGTGTLTGTGTFVVTAGTYTYTVTDANGCSASVSVVVTEPSVLSATASATTISCYGGSSVVTVTASGGTGAYTGTGTFTANAGTSSYTVTDANGCSASASVTITQPSQLVAAASATTISCNGGSSIVTVTATGGTTPYSGTGTYTVGAGTYSYTVTDANGCTSTTTITVVQPTVLTASSTSTSILCNGGSSTVTVTATGGTGPYTGTGNFTANAGTASYTVSDANGCTATTSITISQPTALVASSVAGPAITCNGGTTTITVSAAGGTGSYSGTGVFTVGAGTYSYTVTDANGCTSTTSITISQPTALTASSSATSILCNGGSSTVTVTGNGGTGPYTGTGTFTVSAGTSSYTVTDANGCTATTSITVTQPTTLTAGSTATSISCNGGSATVTVTAAGGTGPYTGTGNFTVTAGTYSYTVTDANGCTATTSITVSEPTVLTAGSTSTSISCNGGSATVTVTAAGGTGPYTGTGNFTVSAGTSSYTVTDANGCTATTSITVTEPTILTASSTSTSISCNGGSATVTVTGNGGTGPYTGTGTFTVSAGTSSYTVTDANGCAATTSITVSQPSALTASSSSAGISCFGGTATVVVVGSGGTGPYTGTGSFSVSAGTYSYTVTDANGCSASTSITISQPTALTASISSTPVLCNGGTSVITVSASGGTGPFTGTGNYTVTAGPHSYTVTDANGCTTSTSTTITQPSALVASSSSTSISCFGGTSVVTVTATGGTTPYNGIGTYTVSAGTHSYTVTDINGCTSNTFIVVTQPAVVNAPTGAASQTFCSTLNATIASIQVTGTGVQWYASNAGGSVLATTTPLSTGTTYYATQTIAGCESPSYLAVTVTIPVASTYYADADGDGFGNTAVSQLGCTQPSGYVLNSTDCNDAVATIYPGAPELCNSVDDNCSGFVDEGCPSTIAGEEPFNAIEAPSAMYSYCSSFYSTLAGSYPSTLAQSTCITGEDRWYTFTTLSTGVTIFIGSNANDIVIELQDANGNLIDVENTVVGIGTEVLTKTGLTIGATYRVGVRNYNSNAQAGGQFSGCIRHLRAGGSDSGTSATWPSTISMCNVFKASYCGGTGVQYRFTWTGLTGIAAGQVYTKTQTSDYLTITSVTPMLPAGCMYNVLVTAIYTIPNGAGTNEVFEMPAATPMTITISTNPLTSLRTTDQCSAGPRYRGAVVASLPWVCGVTNWRWRFTEVNPLNLQTAGLPIEQNRGAASNYITLSTVTALQYGKTYAVQTAPIYSYTGTNYQWGPVTYMCIIGSAGMIIDASQDVSQDAMQDRQVEGPSEGLSENLDLDLSVYPNPSNGEGVTMTLSGLTSDNVQVKVYDALGRKIESKRYVVDGTLQTTLNFKNELSNGLYILEVTNEDVRRSVRFMVEQ